MTKPQILRITALILACSVISLGWAILGGDRLDPPAVVVSCARPKIAEVQKAIEGLGLKEVGISIKDPQDRPTSDTIIMFLVGLGILVPSTALSLGLYNYFCKLAKASS